MLVDCRRPCQPTDARDKLYRAVQETLADPAVTDKLAELGYTPINEDPEAFAAFLKSDIATIADLIKASGVTPQ
jgi:tripartite-type tricarboxylate transporter receptor subunit TctC